MKVIQINKFYFTKGQGGGASRYFFDLTKLLESNGHKVIQFSMQHQDNLATPYSKYFVSNLDLTRPRLNWQAIKNLGRIFWSYEAAAKLEKLIQDTKPDLVHLHNIYYHLTPSILRVCKKYHLPVVMTVHDFNLICPNYSLYCRGKICVGCHSRLDRESRVSRVGGRYYNCFLKKCVKDSYLMSLIAVAEAYFRKWGNFYQKYVDLFLCPSQFVADKLILAGFPMDKIKVLPHFVIDRSWRPGFSQRLLPSLSVCQPSPAKVGSPSQPKGWTPTSRYCLYFGRLEPGKGVDLLVKAVKRLPKINLKIIGSGSQETVLKKLAQNNSNIKFLGWQEKQELARQIVSAEFVIMPSRAYETFGLAVLEAFSFAKPVIASNLGALPELVRHKQSGLLFDVGDIEDLSDKIKYLWDNPDLAIVMGQAGQKLAREKYSAVEHYKQLLKFYLSIDFMSIM